MEEIAAHVLDEYRGSACIKVEREVEVRVFDECDVWKVISPKCVDVAYWRDAAQKGEFYECKCTPEGLVREYRTDPAESKLHLLIRLDAVLNEGCQRAVVGVVSLVSQAALRQYLGRRAIALFGWDDIDRLVSTRP